MVSLGGIMSASEFMGGWPSVFYVPGGLAIIWSLCWFPLVYESPEKHSRISRCELEYLKPISLIKDSDKKVLIQRSYIAMIS